MRSSNPTQGKRQKHSPTADIYPDNPIVGTYTALNGSSFTFYADGSAEHTPSPENDVSYTSGTGSWFVEDNVLYVDMTTNDGVRRSQLYAEIEDEDANVLTLRTNLNQYRDGDGLFSGTYIKEK